MTGSARRRRSGMTLAAVVLGVVVPLVAISPTAHGAVPSVGAVSNVGLVPTAGASIAVVLDLDKPSPTGTCKGNSGNHGQGSNCTTNATADPTPTGTSGTVSGTGATGGATAGPGPTGGVGANQPGTAVDSAAPGAAGPAGAGGTGSAGGARGVGGTGAVGGADHSAGSGGAGGGVALPTPTPVSVTTVPGTNLPLWPILWTGTAVITLVTVAALLFLRDKRRATGTEEPDDATADVTEGDGQPAEQAVPSPRGPIKMDWTESSG